MARTLERPSGLVVPYRPRTLGGRIVASEGTIGDPAVAWSDRRAQRTAQRAQRPFRGLPHARRLVRRLRQRRRGAPIGARRLRTQPGTPFFAEPRRRRGSTRFYALGRRATSHDSSPAARIRRRRPPPTTAPPTWSARRPPPA